MTLSVTHCPKCNEKCKQETQENTRHMDFQQSKDGECVLLVTTELQQQNCQSQSVMMFLEEEDE